MPLARLAVAALLIGAALPSRAGADAPADPAAALERAMSAAEGSLRAGELRSAERRYRAALVEGWLLMGSLEAAAGRPAEARAALRRASTAGPETPRSRPAPAPAHVRLAGIPPEARQDLRQRTTAALARAYLNLGVMQARKQAFSRAAELFASAAELDPVFPRVQYSLGVARFNAQQFEQATGPLARALADQPRDIALKRMLALAWLNTDAFDKAAELLRDDPGREDDPSLQYVYGLALVRGNRVSEAEPVFARLLARHGDTAELNVL
ncbi:MAG TPA: tetratricopeptide repeat protein, partial [Vicinamibacteria bacterium]